MLVFDIGYNMGNFTKEILKLYPDSKVIGIDGLKEYEQFAKDSRIKFLNNVVCDENDKDVSFYVCDSNPGINSINEEWIKGIRHSHFFEKTKREIKVKSRTLSSLISEFGNPDIIKLDIEGAECLALEGLYTKSGLILFEWAEERFYEETMPCISILKDLGYTEFASDTRFEGEGGREFYPNLPYMSSEKLISSLKIVPERKNAWGMIYAK